MLENLGIGSRLKHNRWGTGVVVNEKSSTYTISFIEHGLKEIKKEEDSEVEIIDQLDPDTDLVSMFDIERILTSVVKRYVEYPEQVDLGLKWKGGKIVLYPGDKNLQAKEIPIDALFRKIVMVRDRLRTMEQRINANTKLEDEEKINLQQYITKIYGSLTTFNILFKNEEDKFVGEKSDY
ncbi:MAG: hypothetical protein HYZ42_08455 [Bacteroidetes bacterium]|nr:hypothetical protein [Bacteroidota bacterium]